MAVHNHAHLDAQPRRIPAVIFAFHSVSLATPRGERKYASPGRSGAMELNCKPNTKLGVYLN
jgi:hypothetical protein